MLNQDNSKEYLILHSSEENEQNLINTILKLGYTLVTNNTIVSPEVSVNINGKNVSASSYSFKDVKLTFVRDRNIPNYEILSSYTQQILSLFSTKKELMHKVRRSIFGYFFISFAVLAIAITTYFGLEACNVIETDIFFTIFNFGSAIGFVILLLGCIFISSIISLLWYNQKVKLFRPAFMELSKEIERLSNEAFEYTK
ncbi:MAG: hypothetical protein IJ323_05400 [Clostridia bacterium]|nr:hypothetical protein [Clostridia bacterium]MBQ7897844.1 hypothetical protein [Clostridia bacterium]